LSGFAAAEGASARGARFGSPGMERGQAFDNSKIRTWHFPFSWKLMGNFPFVCPKMPLGFGGLFPLEN